MSEQKTILVVDDEERIRRILEATLSARGYRVVLAVDGQDGLRKAETPVHLVLTDLKMPGLDGLQMLRHLREAGHKMPVIVMTAYGSVDTAVAAMKHGAFDYLVKPFNLDEVELIVERALQLETLEREHRYFVDDQNAAFEDLVGTSDGMRAVFSRIERLARADASVLITGETGTGKELVARAIHSLSARRDRLFVPVNCAAIPKELLESELFGHTRGSFTGASREREGKFELADGGTIFLDEIGDMPLELQPKILRVLEDSRVAKVGANTERDIDIHVISASHRDLKTASETGEFRADLYYRLNVVEVTLPPLRERGDDIVILAQHFLAASATRSGSDPLGLTADATDLLKAYSWPGNVRELRNVCERLTLFSDRDTVSADALCQLVDLSPADGARLDASAAGNGVAGADSGTLASIVNEAEIEAITRALESTGGNKTQAARLLRVSERTLFYKLKKYAGRIETD